MFLSTADVKKRDVHTVSCTLLQYIASARQHSVISNNNNEDSNSNNNYIDIYIYSTGRIICGSSKMKKEFTQPEVNWVTRE